MTQVERGRVVHLTSVHPAKDTRIFLKECRTLAKAGYDVRLVAPGELDEVIEGVRFIPLPVSRNRSERFTATLGRVQAIAVQQDADVYHFHDPELMIVGLALRLRGKRVIYDVHESYRDAMHDRAWIPKPLRGLVAGATGLFEDIFASAFNAVVTATPRIAEHFSPKKTFVVQNFPMLDELQTPSAVPFPARPPELGYVGNLSRERGAVEMVSAIGRVRDDKVRLHLAGKVDKGPVQAEMEADPGWRRVVAYPWLSRAEMAALFGRVRAGLVLFLPARNHIEAMPNKLFEYMSAGLPVIASDFPLWREIVDGSRCGILVDPSRPDLIAKAMEAILADPEEAERMGERGRRAVLDGYNWENNAARTLLACYERVLA
jgi:glycosyltransferase involved in cell wall biosynthesis